MCKGDLQDTRFAESADDAYDEFHDDLGRFQRNLDAAKEELERNMAKVDFLHDEVKKVSSQTHKCLNQINLTISFANSIEKVLTETKIFINQWRGQLEKIQNQLEEAVNSFTNPGWIEWFFSLFEFSATRRASENALAKLELFLPRTDIGAAQSPTSQVPVFAGMSAGSSDDPYNSCKNLQQTIENILSENTISYRLKWRLEKLLVEMTHHSLPAFTKALTKPNTQDARKNYQTIFHPVTTSAVSLRSTFCKLAPAEAREGSPEILPSASQRSG